MREEREESERKEKEGEGRGGDGRGGKERERKSESVIVGTQRLAVADAVSIEKPQECYKLTNPSDRTTLCTPIDREIGALIYSPCTHTCTCKVQNYT